ncbi:MAG: hypothetical protein P1V13_22290 [Rhizobiaceae bacterium]|nr:hypothetical protein [Rhizobiaceae bacterium]
MAGSIPALGYKSRTAAIEALRQQQLSTQAIANRIGIPVKDVRALESSKQRVRRRRAGQARCETVRQKRSSIEIDMDLRQALRPYAVRHEMTIEGLARRILDTVAYDGKVDSVLQVEKGDW